MKTCAYVLPSSLPAASAGKSQRRASARRAMERFGGPPLGHLHGKLNHFEEDESTRSNQVMNARNISRPPECGSCIPRDSRGAFTRAPVWCSFATFRRSTDEEARPLQLQSSGRFIFLSTAAKRGSPCSGRRNPLGLIKAADCAPAPRPSHWIPGPCGEGRAPPPPTRPS